MAVKKSTSRRKKTSRKDGVSGWCRDHSLGLLITVIAVVMVFLGLLSFIFIPYDGNDKRWVRIPSDISATALRDSLKSSLGSSTGLRVYMLWKLQGGSISNSQGAYRVEPGQSAGSIARRIALGRQTPVDVSFTGTRTLEQLSRRIASQLQCSPEEFLTACHEILPDSGFSAAAFPAAFIPDTYEFYWSADPVNVVRRLLDYRNRFWNTERREKARKLGLTPVQVASVAAIVEEETAKRDERPKVARLYLNRLAKGMPLQADPTVKFAVGDFTLRRITGEHLKTDSPYNTYKHTGLTPGPIRIPEASTLDAVLNAPSHPYIYMCAKEDFSGYHNFTSDYSAHVANARRYRAELDRRGIKQ